MATWVGGNHDGCETLFAVDTEASTDSGLATLTCAKQLSTDELAIL